MPTHESDSSQTSRPSRRDFLKTTGAAVTAAAVTGSLTSERAAAAASSGVAQSVTPFNHVTTNAMPTRNLGKTGRDQDAMYGLKIATTRVKLMNF